MPSTPAPLEASSFWPPNHAQLAARGPCLWVDDERQPPPGWLWAKTAPAAIQRLKEGGVVAVSLDHDLGPPSAGTGYDVALWLEEGLALQDRPLPQDAAIHSANPVGRAKMSAALRPRGLRR